MDNLEIVDPEWATLDSKLAAAIRGIITGDLARRVGTMTDTFASDGLLVSGRHLLKMV